MYNDIADREKLLKVADESVVLLKNEQNQLPLARKDGMHILVIGDNAERAHSNGGGSAEIKALYEITPLLGITMQAGGNIRVTYEQGYNARTKGRIWDPDNHTEESWQATSLEEGADTPQSKAAQFDEELAQRAVEAAKEADVVIFVGGLNHDYDTEGKDNESMKLPYAQDELINRLLEVREDMVIVMMTGSPVDMSAWVDKAATLLHMSYAGMEGGTALARVLFGDVNPSGKLPETFPRILEESPAHVLGNFPGDDFVNYGEDIFVGYRYFDTYNVKPLFAFGHGKSYTTFAMKDMRVIADEGASHTVKVTVENVGHMAGAEIVQLYVSDEECSVKRPKKELKAFTKVFLQPGESKEVTLTLTEESFGYYDENRACFVAESGVYVLGVGDASDNIMLTEKITLQNEITYK